MKKRYLVPILLAAAGALNLFEVGPDTYYHGPSALLSIRLALGIFFTGFAFMKFRKLRAPESVSK